MIATTLLFSACMVAACDATDGGPLPSAADAAAPAAAAEAVVAATAVRGVDHQQPRAARHVALLIGISDYRHFERTGPPGQTDLEGPANDLERMRHSLRRWGFGAPEDTRVLRDADASRAGLLDGLRWVATRATDSADVLVIYYSGHGTYAPDGDGDERSTTPGDTLDEGLVPWDARDIHAPAQLLLDDDIRTMLATVGTKNVTLFIDACYSGTATRGPGDAGPGRARGPIGPGGGATFDMLQQPEHTLLTAASAQQLAEELPFPAEEAVFGVFTYHLTRALDGAAPTARYDEIIQQVRAGVSGALLRQTPQLEGERSARLFNVQGDVARRAYALVRSADGGYEIDIGAIHGVRDSATFDIFGAGEIGFGGTPVAQARVVSVAETTSRLRLVGADAAIPAGARAVLARVPIGASTFDLLPVWVDPRSGRADEVGGLPFVRVVADSADARAHVLADSIAYRGLRLPPVDADASVCTTLRRAFAIASFDLIRNPQPPSELMVRARMVPSGTVPNDEEVTTDTVAVGELYDIFVKVEAPRSARIYMTMAVAGFISDPAVLHPAEAALNQPFTLNQWVLVMPRIRPAPPAGLEVLKVVAGSDQFDLHALVNALPACARARGTRDPWKSQPVAVIGWTTLEHRVLIRP
jgi:metacaspase-1